MWGGGGGRRRLTTTPSAGKAKIAYVPYYMACNDLNFQIFHSKGPRHCGVKPKVVLKTR